MAIALAILGVAFAAFCVWLAVRIINRRERWAKWTAALVVGLPVLYVASFGPACWISSRVQPSGECISTAYQPMILVWRDAPDWADPHIATFMAIGTANGRLGLTNRDGDLTLYFPK